MKKNSGQLSLQILILGAVSMFLISGFVLWSDAYVRGVSRNVDKSQAFTIAESGIEYYRWHLAHAPQDFQDGTGGPGPYIHPYFDKNNIRVGEFVLDITPPEEGSTILTIRSTGKVDADPTADKIIEVRMGLPSFARYSVAANADIRFGPGTEVYGQLHSNGGIRFDGVSYNIITSAEEDYNDPDHGGNNEFGVHTHLNPIDPLPPNAVPVRTDVFVAGRSFPVPAVDFTGITQDLADIKTAAQTSGYYRAASGSRGYNLVLKTDDTFDVYRVTRVRRSPHRWCRSSQSGWGTWSVQNQTLLQSNVAFPTNGVLFFEDHLWIEGAIDGAKLIIGAGAFPVNPSTYKNIITNNDLTFTNFDGTDVIGLIAQNNVNVGLYSEDDLRVDAAVIAQNGRVGRHYYNWRCGSTYIRQRIELFGMIGTNQRYGWAYTDGTGYQDRIITYDGNLLYGPPPNFPITASQYDIISWEELK